MEQAQKITELVDAYKKKLTDKQYKDTLEALGELMKVKIPEKEIYVKVRRIRTLTIIYQETEETEDQPSETQVSTLGPTNEFRHSTVDSGCDCCCDAPLKTLEFKSELNETTEYLKVIPDEPSPDIQTGRYTIPSFMYKMLKKHKTVHQGPDILVYLEDNE